MTFDASLISTKPLFQTLLMWGNDRFDQGIQDAEADVQARLMQSEADVEARLMRSDGRVLDAEQDLRRERQESDLLRVQLEFERDESSYLRKQLEIARKELELLREGVGLARVDPKAEET